MKLPVLPAYYYLDHFVEMLEFVHKTYGSILGDEHRAFIARFGGLSRDAQCLLIRMVNRRGTIFNQSLFSYSEIKDIELAAAELTVAGHARALVESDYPAFVACLPRDVLVTGAQAAGRGDVRKSWSKPRFVDYYLAQIPFSVAAQHCGGHKFIAIDGTRPIEFLLYLYFGKTEVDLKNFALRDLGILRTNRETSFNARFTDGAEAVASFYYSQILGRLDVKSEAVYRQAAIDVLGGPPAGRTTPPIFAAVRHIRWACISKRMTRAPSPVSSIAQAPPPTATSAWRACSAARANASKPRNCCSV